MTSRLIISLLAAATMLPGAAQVSKEITVEREVVPTVRSASPLTFTPSVTLPATPRPTLSYSERTSMARIPSLFQTLEPAAVGDSIAASPYRGYAAIGYFPAFNLGASAGYRLLDRSRTTLDAWMQYDGNRYNAKLSPDRKDHLQSHDAVVGINLNAAGNNSSLFNLSLDYAFSSFNNPLRPSPFSCRKDQKLNRLNAQALYSASSSSVDYSIGLGYHLFAFSTGYKSEQKDLSTNIDPVSENRVTLQGSVFAGIDEHSSFGIDLDASMINHSKSGIPVYADWKWYEQIMERPGKTTGLVSVTPAYKYSVDNFSLKAGIRIDFTFNNPGKKFHIAPDVKVAWMPSQSFTLYGQARGGEVMNTMGELYAIERYISQMLWYSMSHIPVEAEAGFRVGPFKGFALNLSATYAAADDWLMPGEPMGGALVFQENKIRGWKFRAAAEYSYSNIASLALSGSLNPQKDDDIETGFYTDRDRAKYIFDAQLTVHPLSQLDIMAGYELRAGRNVHFYQFERPYGWCGTVSQTPFESYKSLENIANLRVGASWRFTPAFTVFLRADNLLGRKTPLLSLLPGQGVHGLAGIAYKF